MTTTPNEPVQAPDIDPSGDPAENPVPTEPGEEPETGPEGQPQPDPEVVESDDTEPGQMPDHDTEVGA